MHRHTVPTVTDPARVLWALTLTGKEPGRLDAGRLRTAPALLP